MTHDQHTKRRGGIFRTAIAAAFAGTLALGGAAAAQDATPSTTGYEANQDAGVDTQILNADLEQVGTAEFTPFDHAVAISITVEGLEPGLHGVHIHETGICQAEGDTPFASAGGHFNPTGAHHGAGPQAAATPGAATPAMDEAHAGDLGNIMVGENGAGTLVVTTDRITLEQGAENSLDDADGSAIVIHADEDDLTTDPSGESGDRVGCGVIFPPEAGTPAASPMADQN